MLYSLIQPMKSRGVDSSWETLYYLVLSLRHKHRRIWEEGLSAEELFTCVHNTGLGHVRGEFSLLMISLGGPSPLWVMPSLGKLGDPGRYKKTGC